MDDIKLRIRNIIKDSGLTIEEFAEKIGTHQSSLSRSLSEKNNVGDAMINKIIIAFGINKDWLLTGEGQMLKSKQKYQDAQEIDPNYMQVELVSKYAYAGYLTGFGDPEYMESLPKIPVIVDHEGKGNYKCFEVRGDSMDDDSRNSYVDGDVILVREVQRNLWRSKLHINKVDFVIVHKDGIVLKQIIEQCEVKGVIKLHSLNPNKIDYPDYEIFLDDCYQIFSVVEIVKRNMRR